MRPAGGRVVVQQVGDDRGVRLLRLHGHPQFQIAPYMRGLFQRRGGEDRREAAVDVGRLVDVGQAQAFGQAGLDELGGDDDVGARAGGLQRTGPARRRGALDQLAVALPGSRVGEVEPLLRQGVVGPGGVAEVGKGLNMYSERTSNRGVSPSPLPPRWWSIQR